MPKIIPQMLDTLTTTWLWTARILFRAINEPNDSALQRTKSSSTSFVQVRCLPFTTTTSISKATGKREKESKLYTYGFLNISTVDILT